jgi:hypothetical protein
VCLTLDCCSASVVAPSLSFRYVCARPMCENATTLDILDNILRIVPVRAPTVMVYATILDWVAIQMVERQSATDSVRSAIYEAAISEQLHRINNAIVRDSDIATIARLFRPTTTDAYRGVAGVKNGVMRELDVARVADENCV